MKIKILLGTFTFYPESNGVARAALEQAMIFSRLGHSVEVFTSENDSGVSSYQGFEIRRFRINGKDEFLYPAKGDIKGLHSFFENGSWDLVVLNCWHIWSTHLAIKYFSENKRKEKLVVISHGFAGNMLLKRTLRGYLGYSLRRPFAWITLPKFLKKIHKLVVLWDQADDDRFYDVKVARKLTVPCEIIPNICSEPYPTVVVPDKFASLEASPDKLILCVGNYSELKNEMFVLEAFKLANVSNATLVFVGHEFNEYQKRMSLAAREIGNTKRVLFYEQLSQAEIAWLYSKAFLLLSGSRTECQPLVIIDAICKGVPFISTPVGCVPNLKGGYVVSTPDQMANLIEKITTDKEIRATLVREANNQSEVFSQQSVEKKYRDLLFSLQ